MKAKRQILVNDTFKRLDAIFRQKVAEGATVIYYISYNTRRLHTLIYLKDCFHASGGAAVLS